MHNSDTTAALIVNWCVMKTINPRKQCCWPLTICPFFSLSLPHSLFLHLSFSKHVYPLLCWLPIWPAAVCSGGCSEKVHVTVAGAFGSSLSLNYQSEQTRRAHSWIPGSPCASVLLHVSLACAFARQLTLVSLPFSPLSSSLSFAHPHGSNN